MDAIRSAAPGFQMHTAEKKVIDVGQADRSQAMRARRMVTCPASRTAPSTVPTTCWRPSSRPGRNSSASSTVFPLVARKRSPGHVAGTAAQPQRADLRAATFAFLAWRSALPRTADAAGRGPPRPELTRTCRSRCIRAPLIERPGKSYSSPAFRIPSRNCGIARAV